MQSFVIGRRSIETLVNPRVIQLLPRCIHTGGKCNQFWEPYKQGHKKYVPKPLTFKEKLNGLRNAYPLLKDEFKLFAEEMKEKMYLDPPIARPGDSEYVFRFNDSRVLKNFIVTSDKDHNEGHSECQLAINEKGKGVFSGHLSNVMSDDGRQRRTGYCNFTSRRAQKSFRRNTYLEWFQYNHLVMRVRGDGRSYMINLNCEGDYDVHWNDMYNYILFTRGGPYWQIAKIPFSKFYLASKGRIQDKQCEIPLSRITSFGITCSDQIPGPFRLEVDYVAIYFDPSHTEKFAYEMYQVPKFTAGL